MRGRRPPKSANLYEPAFELPKEEEGRSLRGREVYTCKERIYLFKHANDSMGYLGGSREDYKIALVNPLTDQGPCSSPSRYIPWGS